MINTQNQGAREIQSKFRFSYPDVPVITFGEFDKLPAFEIFEVSANHFKIEVTKFPSPGMDWVYLSVKAQKGAAIHPHILSDAWGITQIKTGCLSLTPDNQLRAGNTQIIPPGVVRQCDVLEDTEYIVILKPDGTKTDP